MKTRILAFVAVAVLACLSAFSADIYLAADNGDLDQIKALLSARPELLNSPDSQNGSTPLHHAARGGQRAATALLLDLGADREAQNRDRHPPLFCALHNHQLETARLLLDRGAKIGGTDKLGRAALHLTLGGPVDLVALVLERGADVNATNGEHAMTALHWATQKGDVVVVELLLKHGANVLAADADGDTPLHFAARSGRLSIARVLLNHKADANLKNRLGFRPVELVKGRENDELAAFLLAQTKYEGQEQGPEKVGELGDPGLLVLEGNATFPVDELKRGLTGSPSFLLVSHPQANLKVFLGELEHKLTAGYLASGFPSPSVAASYDPNLGRIRVKIVEGKRFNAGPVTVSGVSKTLQSRIRRRLTEFSDKKPSPFVFNLNPDNTSSETSAELGGATVTVQTGWRTGDGGGGSDPEWEIGKPAPFDLTSGNRMETIVQTCLAEEGFLFPKIRITRGPPLKGDNAELRVDVAEGIPGTVVEINLQGHRQNTRAEVLQYLGLRPGMKANRELFEQIDRKLWESARLLEWNVTVQPIKALEGIPGGLRLDLELREMAGAPKLTTPPTVAERALVRCARWIKETPEDLEIQVGSEPVSGRIILSPRKGIFLTAQAPSYGVAYTTVFARSFFGLCPADRGFRVETRDFNLRPQAFLQVVPAPPTDSNTWSLNMGAGVQGVLGQHSAQPANHPFNLRITVPPAAFLHSLATTPHRIEKRVLIIAHTNGTCRVDVKTGRLLELAGTSGDVSLRIRYGKTLFQESRRQFEAQTAPLTNRWSGGVSFGSFMTFIGGELARSTLLGYQTNVPEAKRLAAARAAEKLLGNGILTPVDSFLEKTGNDSFWVPMEDLDRTLAQNSIAIMFSGMIFRYCDAMFPKYSWPWTLARESVFVLASQGKYTDAELQRLHESDDTGPVGSLIIARLLDKMGSPAARTFAVRGLTRLSAGDFQKDCDLLFREGTGLAQMTSVVLTNLSQLSDEEVESLALVLDAPEAALLKTCRQAMAKPAAASLGSRLAPALETYWQTHLRAKVRARLNQLAFPPRSEAGKT